MKCPNCGAELVLGETHCRACGGARPAAYSRFINVEKRLVALRARYQAGSIDQATYTAEVQKLQVQDEAGQWWWLGGEPAAWHWSDGQSWVRRDPSPAGTVITKLGALSTNWRAWPRWVWVVGAVPVLALMIFLIVGVFSKFQSLFNPMSTTDEDAVSAENTAMPAVGEEVAHTAVPAAPLTAQLSEQQQLLVDEFGWPDSFTILEADDDQGGVVRYETWTYYAGKIIYTFFDGVFQVEDYTEPISRDAILSPYHPDQFALGASSDQVGAWVVSGDLIQIPDEGGGLEGIDLYAAEQLIVGFEADRLVYVDALVFLPEGGEP
jgi:hypothetical protein